MTSARRLALSSTALAGALLLGRAAQAQEAPVPPADAPAPQAEASPQPAADGALTTGDIVVTATRRETNVQTTALAISAVSGEALERRQVVNIEALAAQLPNVNLGQTTGNARINIRGVGYDSLSVGQEGRTAFHTDGVYISRPAAQLAGFYDIERVEVLRGPQGTLYGRNATGGAVNVITRDPSSTPQGYGQVTIGNYGLVRAEAAVGGPLADGVDARIAGQLVERDGFGRALVVGGDVDDLSTRAVRAKLRFRPNDQFSLLLEGDYFHQDDRAYVLHYIGAFPGVTPRGIASGGAVPDDPRDVTTDVEPSNVREFWGLAATADLSLGGVDVTSITAYRDSSFDLLTDLDVTSAPVTVYNQLETGHHFSHELRVAGEYGRGDFLLGAFYFYEDLFGGTRFAVVPPPARATSPAQLRQGIYVFGELKTEAYAFFANGSFDVTDRLTLRVGGRFSRETKRVNEQQKTDFASPFPPFVGFSPTGGARQQRTAGASSFTPQATLEYKPNDGLFLYATVAQGFKSGGFNLGNVQPPFAAEKITDYEGGIRADWFGGLLRTNVSAFYYDYSDLQVSKVTNITVTIENAASATVKGIEAEVLLRPTSRLRIEGALSLLDATYDEYLSADPARPTLGVLDLSGNKLNQAPEYSGNVAVSYTLPVGRGSVELRGEGRFSGKYFFSGFNLDAVSQPAFETYNAFLNAELGGGLYGSLFVRNITNERIISAEFVTTALVGFPIVGSFQDPRTYGGSIGFRF